MWFARLRKSASLCASLWLGLTAPALAAAPGAAAPAVPVPTAIAVEIKADGPRTRLTFTLSEPVEARSFVMERPDRLVIELPRVNFQLPAESGRRREGLVTSLRYGLFARGAVPRRHRAGAAGARVAIGRDDAAGGRRRAA